VEEPVAVAGFRLLHTLAWGYVLYVDDLVTRADFRGKGHARRLMEWLFAEADRLGCDQLHLDSGPQRIVAHRFYFNQGLHINSYHFAHDLRQSFQ
jgi:GNAT superfamily N-acetyltransferase